MVVALPTYRSLLVDLGPFGLVRYHGLAVCMCLEIHSHPTQESLPTKMVTQHPDHGTSLEVANMIEYLVNL